MPGEAQWPGTTARYKRLFVDAVLWRARYGVSEARLACRAVWALAHGVRPVSALASGRRVAASAGPGAKRDVLASAHGRLHGRAGAPGGRWCEKKVRPVGQALGRSGFTTNLYLSCDAYG